MKKMLMLTGLVVAVSAAGLIAQENADQGTLEEQDVEDVGPDPDEIPDVLEGAPGINHTELFIELDTDEDGVLSREEVEAAEEYPELAEQFDELDTAGTGVLTIQEFMHFEPGETANGPDDT